jgi:hypothetical protein
MLIATFGSSTGWAGKTITKEGDVFVLQDHGPISAADVMEYDRQGHLIWADEGTRAWIGSLARAQTTPRSDSPLPQVRAATTANSRPAAPMNQKADARTDGQKAAGLIGLLLLVLGIGVAGYFLLFFDVSVPVDYQGNNSFGLPERVNNIGLMADRNNGIIIGLVLAVAGGVLMVVGRKRSAADVPTGVGAAGVAPAAKGFCSSCGAQIDVGVSFCPHCGQQLAWTGTAAPPS